MLSAEGGGLYSLGLIRTNHGGDITEYLLDQVKDAVAYAQETQPEKKPRGLAVGSSLVMYSRLEEADPLIESLTREKENSICNLIKRFLKTSLELSGVDESSIPEEMRTANNMAGGDDTISVPGLKGEECLSDVGEVSGSGLPPPPDGSVDQSVVVDEDGSFVMYGRLEEADPIIESHTRDKDAFTITMAYCGTGDNSAIRELLYEAVSDVSDDVRRAAVMGLGKHHFSSDTKLLILLPQDPYSVGSQTTASAQE